MIHKAWFWLACFCGLASFVAFCLSALDKRRASRGKSRVRVPEKVLLAWGAFGGAPGLGLSMLLFRHKTRKRKFTLSVPFFLLLQAAVLYGCIYADI